MSEAEINIQQFFGENAKIRPALEFLSRFSPSVEQRREARERKVLPKKILIIKLKRPKKSSPNLEKRFWFYLFAERKKL